MTVVTESEFLARLGGLAARGGDTHVLCCLLAYLRLYGYRGELARVLSAAPVPAAGADARTLRFLARRLGLTVLPLARERIDEALAGRSVLLMRADGGAALLLGVHAGGYSAWTPEQPGTLTHLPAGAAGDAMAWTIARTGSGILLNRRPRAARFWLLDAQDVGTAPAPAFDRDALRRVVDAYLADAPPEAEPAPLTEWDISGLLRSHASISPDHPQYFGRFRCIDLRPEAGFVDAPRVPGLMRQLLERAAQRQADPTHDPIVLAAQVFSDYLTIHPFLNGNRRVGMALVSAVLARDGLRPDWRAITLTECYYMVRCAARGHLRPMVARLRSACAVAHRAPRALLSQALARQPLPDRVWQVLRSLHRHGCAAWLVGGAVRNLLAGIVPADFDIVTNAGSADIFALFDTAHIVGGRFQVVVVVFPGGSVEVSTLRDGGVPARGLLAGGASADDALVGADAALRDFTVNALYYDPIGDTLLDPANGAADLAAHTLRTIGDPAAGFADDPLRALRGIRHAVQLRLAIEPATMEALCGVKTAITRAPPARLARELGKVFKSGNMVDALNILFVTHLLEPLLPAVHRQMFDQRTKDFLTAGLALGDRALAQGEIVAPAYFLAVLLWADVRATQHACPEKYGAGLRWELAVDQVLAAQTGPVKLVLESAAGTRGILALQSRLDAAAGHEELRKLSGWRDAWRLLDARRLAHYC